MAKHSDIYQEIVNKIGLKEDQKYKEFYNPEDKFGESLRYLALRNFKRFVAVLDYLIQKNDFDLILFGGDSGVGLSKVTELVYEQLSKKPAMIISLPIIRWEPKWLNYTGQETKRFDNSIFIPQIKEKINSLEKIENILFIDDEIESGNTAKALVNLVLQSLEPTKPTPNHLFIVAEDQHFNPDNFLENMVCDFYPFAEIEGISNVLSYVVPWNIEKQIREHFMDEEMGSKVILNSLLNLPSKEFERFPEYIMEKPKFTDNFIIKLKNELTDFEQLQQEFSELVRKLIKEAINEYDS